MHWGDCVCPVPCSVFTENTKYVIKDNNVSCGHIEEESSFICRMCIPAYARTQVSKIKVPGGGDYIGVKNF